jgi:DNA-binding response OmpR family regulator
MIVQELSVAGYDVTEARSGSELLDEVGGALLSGERSARPDVIVSDIRMPGFFALDILAGLRDESWSTGMVVITGYPDDETRRRVAGLGAALFEKPFEVEDLLAAVRQVNPVWRGTRWPTDIESPSSFRVR